MPHRCQVTQCLIRMYSRVRALRHYTRGMHFSRHHCTRDGLMLDHICRFDATSEVEGYEPTRTNLVVSQLGSTGACWAFQCQYHLLL
jgi:hypothetical protein